MSDPGSSSQIALYRDVTRVETPPEHHNDAIGQFDRYWRSLQGRLGRFPSRKDLDPISMGSIVLPWMLLVELREDDDGLFFHYRLCGTEIANLVGRDVTGKSTREVVCQDNLKIIIEPYFVTLREKSPSFWKTSVYHDLYDWRPAVRGVWPLSASGDQVDMFVNLTVPVFGRPAKGR